MVVRFILKEHWKYFINKFLQNMTWIEIKNFKREKQIFSVTDSRIRYLLFFVQLEISGKSTVGWTNLVIKTIVMAWGNKPQFVETFFFVHFLLINVYWNKIEDQNHTLNVLLQQLTWTITYCLRMHSGFERNIIFNIFKCSLH